jgi:ABC-2 type transport system ATP-binding protein
VLFLDEPTTGLDPEVRAEMWSEIQGLTRDGLTVLLTTHYLEEADKLAAEVAIVDRGRVVASGTPEQLKSELRDDVIRIRVAEADRARGLAALERAAETGAVEVDGVELSVRTRHGAAALPRLLAALDQRGISATSLTLARPSLDDVYLRHAGRHFDQANQDAEAPEEVAA